MSLHYTGLGYLTPDERTELNSLMDADPAAFVAKVYQNALDRAGTPAEIDFQVQGLATAWGGNRQAFLDSILASPEYRATSAPPAGPSGVENPHPVIGPGGTQPASSSSSSTTAAGIPVWVWGAGAAAVYFAFFRKR